MGLSKHTAPLFLLPSVLSCTQLVFPFLTTKIIMCVHGRMFVHVLSGKSTGVQMWLFIKQYEMEKAKGGLFRGECHGGMQCNLGAKVKATVVHAATVLRPPVTSECGALSPSLIQLQTLAAMGSTVPVCQGGTTDASDNIITQMLSKAFKPKICTYKHRHKCQLIGIHTEMSSLHATSAAGCICGLLTSWQSQN